MNKNRPVNLDISTIKLPITAFVSITHRATGMVLLGGVLLLLWMLDTSLSSEEGFESIQELLEKPLFNIMLWAVLAALAYHLVMGIRHLIMDLGFGETLEGGRIGATLGLIVSGLLIIAAGGWLLW